VILSHTAVPHTHHSTHQKVAGFWLLQ